MGAKPTKQKLTKLQDLKENLESPSPNGIIGNLKIENFTEGEAEDTVHLLPYARNKTARFMHLENSFISQSLVSLLTEIKVDNMAIISGNRFLDRESQEGLARWLSQFPRGCTILFAIESREEESMLECLLEVTCSMILMGHVSLCTHKTAKLILFGNLCKLDLEGVKFGCKRLENIIFKSFKFATPNLQEVKLPYLDTASSKKLLWAIPEGGKNSLGLNVELDLNPSDLHSIFGVEVPESLSRFVMRTGLASSPTASHSLAASWERSSELFVELQYHENFYRQIEKHPVVSLSTRILDSISSPPNGFRDRSTERR